MHLYSISRRGICAQMRMAIKLRRLLPTFAIAVRAFILQDAVFTIRSLSLRSWLLTKNSCS